MVHEVRLETLRFWVLICPLNTEEAENFITINPRIVVSARYLILYTSPIPSENWWR